MENTTESSLAMDGGFGGDMGNLSLDYADYQGYTYAYAVGPYLDSFHDFYQRFHGYIASVVCVLGILANILNIVVLTRKNMISPTNCILTGLAFSDGLTMLAYLPFALRFYCLYGTEVSEQRNSLGAMRFLLFYACFSVVVHTVSIWLTVTLTIFRYIAVKYPRYGTTVCTLNRAKLAVFLNFAVTLVVCIPNFVTMDLQGGGITLEDNTSLTVWFVGYKTESAADEFLRNFNFWVQAILVKLIPCVGLTILSILLIKTMKNVEKKRQNLKMKSRHTCAEQDKARQRKTNRTTRMLLVVVFLFLLTEFPQGILTLLNGILSKFADDIYGPLGDLMDILALTNNGVNFILYCSMSKQFRDTFVSIFLVSCDRNNVRFNLVAVGAKTRV